MGIKGFDLAALWKVRLKRGEASLANALTSKEEGRIVPEYRKTFAQLPLKIKNRISHRGRALEKAKQVIKGILLKDRIQGE